MALEQKGPQVNAAPPEQATEVITRSEFTTAKAGARPAEGDVTTDNEEPSDTEILEQEEIGRKLLDEGRLFNADEVRRALAVLIEPGAVFEIRALDAPRRGSG